MRINEVITESAELEEGWKSKLAGAALAGAAALGGGHAAHAQNHQPTAQTQQVQSQVPKEIRMYVANGTQRTMEAQTLAQMLGRLYPYAKEERLNSDELKLYNKFLKLLFKSKEYYDSKEWSSIEHIWGLGANRKLSNLSTEQDPLRIASMEWLQRHNAEYELNMGRGVPSPKPPSNALQNDAPLNAINPNVLSDKDQKFVNGFRSDLNKVKETLDKILASKPSSQKMEATRKDLANVMKQYDSALDQAMNRGLDKSLVDSFRFTINNIKRAGGIPLDRK